jgi:hypothetical protein
LMVRSLVAWFSSISALKASNIGMKRPEVSDISACVRLDATI